MHQLRTSRSGRVPVRDAVAEAHAERKYEVRRSERGVRRVRAVEPGHAKRAGVGALDAADSHQRRHDGNVRLGRERSHVARRIRGDHAAAGEQHGAPGLVEPAREPAHLGRSRRGLGMVRPERDALRIVRGGELGLHVPRHVYDDRAGLSVRRDVERLGDRLRYLVRRLHEEAVLGCGAADARHVRLLECVGADLRKRHLSGHQDERHAVHVGGREAGYRVGGAWSARHDHHPGAPGGARVAVGHVDASLLVAPEDEAELRRPHAVEDVHDVPAGIAEHHLGGSPLEAFDERLRARSARPLQLNRSIGALPRGPSSPSGSS